VIVGLSSTPTFPADPAFAGRSLLLPLGTDPSVQGTQSFSTSLGGVRFDFATTSARGFQVSCSVARGCELSSIDAPITLTVTPPVPALGAVVRAGECDAEVTFVGTEATETGTAGFNESVSNFVGAADIGLISSATFTDTCFPQVFRTAVLRTLLFVPVASPGDADLALSKTANADVIGAEAALTYGIDVANTGTDTARNVTLHDFLPPFTTIEGLSGNPVLQPRDAPGTAIWSLPDLVPSAADAVGLSLRTPTFGLGSGISCQDSLLNIAEITTSTGEPNLGNNLALRNTPFDKASRAGHVEDCNNGLDDDCNGFRDCNDGACAGTTVCNPVFAPAPPPPEPGGPPPRTSDGTPECTLSVHGTQVPLVPCCCDSINPCDIASLCRPVDPNFKESDPPTNAFGYGYAHAGQTVRYTIHYENIGGADAHDVSILDPLHPGLDETTLQIEGGGTFDPASRTIVWRDPLALPPHVPRSVSFSAIIRADAEPATQVRNRATILFPEADSPRTDTNFVEHTIVDPAAPVVADLFVKGCSPAAARSPERKVTLVNQGFGFAYNVTAEVVNPPRFLQVTDGVARFVHPDDPDPTSLTTVMPLSTSISEDTVSIARARSHGDDGDGDDDEADDGDEGDDHGGRAARGDPCDVLTWRIRYTTSTGEVVSKDVPPSIPRLCPCSGPAAGEVWENHGAYVSCVARAAARFRRAGLLTESEAHGVVRAAARSSCAGHGRSDDDQH
jgi:uncharacterized repeat protein (TIGR01451 family)